MDIFGPGLGIFVAFKVATNFFKTVSDSEKVV
jgi:hypothetical protein